jgi:hypothetical protein
VVVPWRDITRKRISGAKLRNLFAFLITLMICHTAYPAELFGTIDAISGNASVSDKSGEASSLSAGQKIYEEQTMRLR